MNRIRIKNKTSAERIAKFKKAVRYGPIFPCCSCEQMMFNNGVVMISKEFLVLQQLLFLCNLKLVDMQKLQIRVFRDISPIHLVQFLL